MVPVQITEIRTIALEKETCWVVDYRPKSSGICTPR